MERGIKMPNETLIIKDERFVKHCLRQGNLYRSAVGGVLFKSRLEYVTRVEWLKGLTKADIAVEFLNVGRRVKNK
jgi:hypothetical protein